MNTRNLFYTLCVAATMTASACFMTSCKNDGGAADKAEKPETAAAQRQVNDFITTLGQYTLSMREATSLEEIDEMHAQFLKQISKYADSKEEINDADRQAILAAMEKYSIAVNSQMEKLTGESPITFEEVQRDKEILKNELAKCRTLGQVISL